MSELSKSILAVRVTNVRARLIGSVLIILVSLLVTGILYSLSLSRMNQAVIVLEEAVAQTNALPAEQQAAAFAETEAARRAMWEVPLAWGLLIAIAALSTTAITIGSIAQPVERMTEVAERLAEGNLAERVQVEWADEFGRLATAFNEMTDRLQASHAKLEQQVAERTAALERRSTQLEAAAQVAREAAAIYDVGQLLDATVHLISERFGFYHAGVFLLDEPREYAVLQAASSEGGRRMLARGHQLKVGEVGIVGYVAGSGQPRVALDVGEDAVFFDNPDLPLTRSEMALPLKVRDHLIGVLDVQSTEAAAFTDEDVAILQTMADQVALAIENARLLEEAEERLQEVDLLLGRQGREGWARLAAEQPRWGYTYDGVEVVPRHTARVADGEAEPQLTVPLQVRGEVFGHLALALPDQSLTPDAAALAQAIANQASMALENARLYQDTQRRAARERLIGEVTARVRETLDMETVLKTAAQEVRQALGLPEVVLRLAAQPVDGVGRDGGNHD